MNYLYVVLGISLLIGGFYILLNLPSNEHEQKRVKSGAELIQNGISEPSDAMKGVQAFLLMFLAGIGLVIYGLAQIFDWKINSN